MERRYKVTSKRGKVSYYDNINVAIAQGQTGDTITDTRTGQTYKVQK
jgi:hypothetical protein